MEERMERTIRKIVEPIGLRLRLVSCSASVSGRDVRDRDTVRVGISES